MEGDALIGNVIQRPDSRRAGVIVVIVPGHEHTVVSDAAGDVDDPGRSEVSPGKFLFACPDQLDRTSYRACQTSSLDGNFAGMLTTISTSGIRNDHANIFFGHAECRSKLA